MKIRLVVLLYLSAFGINMLANGVNTSLIRPGQWHTWPKNNNCVVEFHGSNDARTMTCKVKDNGQLMLYSYIDAKSLKRYELTFNYSYSELNKLFSDAAKVSIMFNGADGKNGGIGTISFALPLNQISVGKTLTFKKEFKSPENVAKIVISPLNIKDMTGIFKFSEMKVEEISDTATIPKIINKINIDGVLDEPEWDNAGTISRFYLCEKGSSAQLLTTAKVLYDNQNLYIGVLAQGQPGDKLKRLINEFDGPVWKDDSIEVMIAPELGRKIQLIVNSNNVRLDGELYIRVPGDAYRLNSKWNGNWQSACKVNDDGWSLEIAIPYENFDAKPQTGSVWRLNVIRNSFFPVQETVRWNRCSGMLNNVDKFNTMTFGKEQALLQSIHEEIQKDPLAIIRKGVDFSKLPRDNDNKYNIMGLSGAYILSSYDKDFQKKHNAEWDREQRLMLDAIARSGIKNAPLGFPWAEKEFGGREGIEKLVLKYNFKFGLAIHQTSHDRKTIKDRRASYVSTAGRVAVDVTDLGLRQTIEEWLNEYFIASPWIVQHLAYARGSDEPTNSLDECFSFSKNKEHHATLLRLNQHIKEKFGYSKYGLYDAFATITATDAFNNIAMMRWWNNELFEAKKSERTVLKRFAPGVPYMPIVVNTTRSDRGVVDYAQIAEIADWFGIDPYPTSCLTSFSRERALYHSGFSTKMARDLAPQCETYVYAQAFKYCGMTPTPENLREWTAQIIKSGGTIINWYSSRVLNDSPELLAETLRISHLLTSGNRLLITRETETGILYSQISAWGTFDNAHHGHYNLYSILGEYVGSNFRFVSDSQLHLNRSSLADLKLLYVPLLKYTDLELLEKIMSFVSDGGTAVFFDPEALTWSPDGQEIGDSRKKLLGSIAGVAKAEEEIIVKDGFPGLAAGTVLSVQPPVNRRSCGAAFAVNVPDDGTVIATYSDGSPAAYMRKVGKGSIYYLGAQLLGNSLSNNTMKVYEKFTRALAGQIGEKTDIPLWQLTLPSKGSEIDYKTQLTK